MKLRGDRGGFTPMTDDVTRILRDAYDGSADERAGRPTPVWETEQRDAFLKRLGDGNGRTILDVGAATGVDGLFFEEQGFDVVCVDLSPKMVERCRARGLTAHVGDVADLKLPAASFDAVFAMNCLVHVPSAQLDAALAGVHEVLKPGGLFCLAMYGGRDFEGVWDGDYCEPKRFFRHYRDEDLESLVAKFFAIETFHTLPHGWEGLHFQSLVLRRS